MAQKHDTPEYVDAPMTRAGTLELVASRRQIRSDAFTAARWAAVNPILQLGEMGYETDTNKLKVGDGVTAWTDLGYVGGGDDHNKGYYTDLTALQTAYPTGEDGDYAIVGSTDTVWVWDSGTSAWVDTDTKGEVTSVNGQTGEVSLSIPDAVQYSSMPTASVDNLGDIVQFTGTTDANYTNGYFYKCVSDGQEPATYSWSQVSVQPAPSGLPDQTGQSGKFLTTDGTDASWSDKPLVNTATGTDSIMVGNNTTNRSGVVAIGKTAQVTGLADFCVVVGDGAKCSSAGGVSLGDGAETAYDGVAIGRLAKATGGSAIQIGARGTNSVVGTLQVSLSDSSYVRKDYRLLDYDGTVPHGRLTNAVVSNAVTIAVADWNGGTTCTKTISGLTATSVVWVAPDNASQSDYLTAGVYASAQTTDTITFTCTTTPTSALTVYVIYC